MAATEYSKKYRLQKSIQENPLYKVDLKKRDTRARDILESQGTPIKDSSTLVIGTLYMMDYREPRMKEELEYYDASPVILMFGRGKNQRGEERILGFNLHYYPPKYRWIILDKIFDIFRSWYKERWDGSSPVKDIPSISYQKLLGQLEKQGLDFGVRMYDPSLITRLYYIPPRYWETAAFTEGRFHKKSRAIIMDYWRKWVDRKK